MNAKIFGGILLISGTCIGGGMLGLPIATAKSGLFGSSLLFISCWALMTFTALLTLEVNLYFPKNSNVISMSRATLGKPGEIVCWTVYLCFLYSLVSAYIAGGQDVLRGFLSYMGMNAPLWICAVTFVFIFGSIVIAGIERVDIFNRLLMIIKFGTIILLMYFISKHIHIDNYIMGDAKYIIPSITVAVTSFGFSIIVPSLRSYFDDDIPKLRIAIILGSFIPLICYIAWEASIFGLVPLSGSYGLERLINENQPVTALLQSITYYLPTTKIHILASTFTSICVLTAFACVSLGLSDYLADGFKINKQTQGKYLVTLLTFAPPLLVVTFYPKAFMLFLSLAGLFCVILQSLMPAMMAWNCRYTQKMSGDYQVYGGKFTLTLAVLASSLIIFMSICQMTATW